MAADRKYRIILRIIFYCHILADFARSVNSGRRDKEIR